MASMQDHLARHGGSGSIRGEKVARQARTAGRVTTGRVNQGRVMGAYRQT